MSVNLFGRRSALFLPASNPRAVAKAREAGADLVILDLEDAVKEADKDAARVAAVAAVATGWPCPVAIRVNGFVTDWHGADVEAVAGSSADFVVVPRVDGPAVLQEVLALTGKPVAAMVETALGVRRAWEIAESAAALIAGTNDLAADLRLPTSGRRPALQTALQTIVLAARAAGKPCFDGVYNRLDDPDGFSAEAGEGRSLGFDGKTLIHPNQVAPCHAAFAPLPEEVARAERLVAAASGGAQRFEGEMIERMHVEAAERLLERAR
ncbi:CoA ester lyase [Sphingomonas sp. BN140010]|uniref:CoA ester lyase n=1 Tax=Sphingomonas arvum TaxID=2992113 RepID=A0ABT3JIQ4_9SPHN|nr:CoA ester lyase [Sphingomonas sp. BN140010]MCW3798671.1 CoA ester lyase [Sphingomonas sp. BN140010]